MTEQLSREPEWAVIFVQANFGEYYFSLGSPYVVRARNRVVGVVPHERPVVITGLSASEQQHSAVWTIPQRCPTTILVSRHSRTSTNRPIRGMTSPNIE